MTNPFWNYTFNDSAAFVETFDELPLWSAPFGLLLLKHLDLKHDMTVIDTGSGAGFPLFELAERLGPTCQVYGIDPWTNATDRARKKKNNYDVKNVEIVEGSADKMPFEPGTADLIVSNLGINNFDNPEQVFKECYRVLKPDGKLALTTNLNGHWKVFYKIFEETLQELNKHELVEALTRHQEHRGTVESISSLFTKSGFRINRVIKDSFDMRFLDGTAFLNHHFIQVGWLSSWLELIPVEFHESVFSTLEANLNAFAKNAGGLTLQVPMVFIEGRRL